MSIIYGQALLAGGFENAGGPMAKSGSTDPTSSTAADYVGQIYLNTTSKESFICTAINEAVYTWDKVVDGSKTTEITSSSTDDKLPSAKAVYDDVYTSLNSSKENIGYFTINGTTYQVKTSTIDAGEDGYITIVVPS